MKVFMSLGWFFKERRKEYGIGLFMLILVAVMQIIPPRVIGITIDEMGAGTLTAGSLAKWLGLIAGTAILMLSLIHI